MPDIAAELRARASALAPDFVLDREVGRGGMGVVYRGVDVKLDRPVAIKVLPEALGDVPDVRERFLREARTAARLSHQNIVPIYRADELHGVVFIVMAFVDGESLGERLASRGALPAQEVLPILRDVARALDNAHALGIVHRDVKPENILIDRKTGRAMVTDFGIARVAEAKPLTATGQVLGTVHYMSPEQVSGDAVDGRSDLYSLGVVGFRALTGRLPFDNESASAVLVAHVVKPAPRVHDVAVTVPAPIARLIDRCLAKDPEARAAAGESMASLFDEALAAMEREAPPPAPPGMPNVISEREAQALWSRAAELQAMTGVQTPVAAPARLPLGTAPTESLDSRDRRTLTSGYRYSDVRDAAEEAGIPERYLSRAAAELGVAPEAPNESKAPRGFVDDTPRASVWSGAPMSILYEVHLPGEVPESELYVLVDTIRRHMGEPGHVGTIGRSVSWSSTGKSRRLQISIVARHGKTSIRVDERLGQLAGALYGGIVGGGGGGSGGAAIGIGVGAFHSGLMAVSLWGGIIAGTTLLARTIFKAQVRSRREKLRALVLELADQARDLMRTLPSGSR
jgi:eukaryotic-like serine/threonine-protein kinase